ncbi:GFA family protein [Thiomicrorhabdus sp. 6S3-12]|uniref:GFA family protein n=1 Tax=Thiomicrorhabdus sp. 6S3-12 TaxID=2819681 RepID=UPI001AADB55B|nr:GFA family protein [Thiomicrorhabdus sp. 6S3-12]
MEYSGSCLCGAVQFKVEGEFESFYLCHCRYCQKDTGSAHAANLFSSTAKLEWIKGENNVRVFQVKKSNHIKAFCMTCGSAVPNVQMEGRLLVVPAGSLDCTLDKRPDGHLFISSKANWDEALETVPKYQRLPNEE